VLDGEDDGALGAVEEPEGVDTRLRFPVFARFGGWMLRMRQGSSSMSM
jgi:hypothetical protein